MFLTNNDNDFVSEYKMVLDEIKKEYKEWCNLYNGSDMKNEVIYHMMMNLSNYIKDSTLEFPLKKNVIEELKNNGLNITEKTSTIARRNEAIFAIKRSMSSHS